MFYEFVKTKVQTGKIKVAPDERETVDKLHVEAKGIAAIAAWFLSREEKQQIADLSKYIAMRQSEVRHQFQE